MKFNLTFAEALELAFWSGAVVANSVIPEVRYRVKQSGCLANKPLQMRHTRNTRKGFVSTKWGETPVSLLPAEVRAKWRVVKVGKARGR